MKDVETWKAELQVLPRFQLGCHPGWKWAERERGNTPEATVLSCDQCSPCEVLHSRMRPTGSVIHLLLLGSLRVLWVPGLSRDAHLLGPISIAGQSGLGEWLQELGLSPRLMSYNACSSPEVCSVLSMPLCLPCCLDRGLELSFSLILLCRTMFSLCVCFPVSHSVGTFTDTYGRSRVTHFQISGSLGEQGILSWNHSGSGCW